MRIRRLDEQSADHYIDFLEKNGTANVNDIAKRILPTGSSENNIVGAGAGKLSIFSHSISLSLLTSETEDK